MTQLIEAKNIDIGGWLKYVKLLISKLEGAGDYILLAGGARFFVNISRFMQLIETGGAVVGHHFKR